MGFTTLRGLLCLGVLAISGVAHAEKKVVGNIEAYGDSITAGFLSDRNVLQPPGLSTISAIMSELITIELNGDKHQFSKYEARDVAWPAVLRGWLAATSRPTSISNVAVSGGFVSELNEQVDRAGASGVPTAAFFWIGHNDLCNNQADPEQIGQYFTGWYKDALERWDRNHTDSTAYIFPIGDIHRVYKALDGYTWYTNGETKFKCDDSWLRLFPYCRPNSRLAKAGKFDDYFLPRQAAVGKALSALAARMGTSSRNNKFVFLDKLLTDAYKTGFFSIDCYHLSKVGQSGVATEVFRRVGKELMGSDESGGMSR